MLYPSMFTLSFVLVQIIQCVIRLGFRLKTLYKEDSDLTTLSVIRDCLYLVYSLVRSSENYMEGHRKLRNKYVLLVNDMVKIFKVDPDLYEEECKSCFSSKKVLHHLCTIVTFFPTFCKLLGKLLKFIDKTLMLLIEIVIKHVSLYFSCCYNRGIEAMGLTGHILQKSQLLKF